MCFGSSPKAPPPAAVLPEAPRAPAPSTESTANKDKRRRAGAGQSGTILTGPRGVQDGAGSGGKTLLGA